tara:strand:- start:140 stop:397 length:258 start_codon:yes stop_codon:yes gene_type:complete
MIDILKDIEDLEKVLKLLTPGSINDTKNKKAVISILTNMLNYKVSEFKLFEETFSPTDFGLSGINFNKGKGDDDKFDPVVFKKAI